MVLSKIPTVFIRLQMLVNVRSSDTYFSVADAFKQNFNNYYRFVDGSE